MKQKKQQRPLQWHPAFYADLQIELDSEKQNLIYENEHQLGTKPLEIDVLIIKNKAEEPIFKNIGRIFQRYNIIEYKSPDDYVSISDYYKVYAYVYLYKSEHNIPRREMTITFACSRYPVKLMQYLKREKACEICKMDDGIYHIIGTDIPVQLISIHQLSREKNLWLRSIGGKLSGWKEAEELIREYKEHKWDKRYRSVMDLIVRVNRELFMEVKEMCQALEELMADEMEAMRESGWREGEKYGWESGKKCGTQEGMNRFARLSILLLKENHQEQLLKASEDAVYREELFKKYNI